MDLTYAQPSKGWIIETAKEGSRLEAYEPKSPPHLGGLWRSFPRHLGALSKVYDRPDLQRKRR